MRKNRDAFFNEGYNNYPYPVNNMQMPFNNNIDERLAKIERQLARLEHRINYLENGKIKTTDEDFSNNMYMI